MTIRQSKGGYEARGFLAKQPNRIANVSPTNSEASSTSFLMATSPLNMIGSKGDAVGCFKLGVVAEVGEGEFGEGGASVEFEVFFFDVEVWPFAVVLGWPLNLAVDPLAEVDAEMLVEPLGDVVRWPGGRAVSALSKSSECSKSMGKESQGP